MLIKNVLLGTLAFALSGCVSLQKHVEARTQKAFSLAENSGFRLAVYQTSLAPLQGAYSMKGARDEPTVIYIEGDGFAWISPTEPSPDPTPVDPLTLRLAVQDKSPNVIYLARPCQYVGQGLAACHSNKYWTSHRFSPEVINAYHEVFSTLKRSYGSKTFHIVGYSGGGAIATLVAAQRKDIASLRTLAGNLNHDIVNQHHGVNLMPQSLNPVDVASQLVGLPQHHYIGAIDTLIPQQVIQSYKQALGDTACLKIEEVKRASHYMGWQSFWQKVASKKPVCK